MAACHSIGRRILKDLQPRPDQIKRGANETGHQPAANARAQVADAGVVLMMVRLAFFFRVAFFGTRIRARHSSFASSDGRRKRSAKSAMLLLLGGAFAMANGGAAAAAQKQQPKEEDEYYPCVE